MRLRAILGRALLAGWVLGVAGCATTPVKPPPVVATVPVSPPQMPAGGYIGMKIPHKLADGTYVTPNIANTDQAAVWHLRNALNVAALGCDHAGGGIVEPYNAWLTTHAAVLDHYLQAYRHEWQATGWWDWERVYDNNQTRIYNFYSQPTMRAAFCAVARGEIVKVGQVADADLPAFARGALLRLDKPFIDFYKAFDAWRDYYEPAPPPVVRTIDTPIAVATPAPVATLDGKAPPALDTVAPSTSAPGDTPVALAAPAPPVTGSGGSPVAGIVAQVATAP